MTALARHFIPLMVIVGMLTISLTFVRLMLGLLGRQFTRPPSRSDSRGRPDKEPLVIDGSYADVTPGRSEQDNRAPGETRPVPPAGAR